jgi:hypothetical protein
VYIYHREIVPPSPRAPSHSSPLSASWQRSRHLLSQTAQSFGAEKPLRWLTTKRRMNLSLYMRIRSCFSILYYSRALKVIKKVHFPGNSRQIQRQLSSNGLQSNKGRALLEINFSAINSGGETWWRKVLYESATVLLSFNQVLLFN